MVFHHKNPSQKEFEISSVLTSSWDRIKIELDRCELLCANCHYIEHTSPIEDKFLDNVKLYIVVDMLRNLNCRLENTL